MSTLPCFVLHEKHEPNIWRQICAEYDAKRHEAMEFLTQGASEYVPPESRVPTPQQEYRSDQHHPSFLQNRLFKKSAEDDVLSTFEFDFAVSHPSVMGYAFVEKPPSTPPMKEEKVVDPKSCSSREYLEHHIFPFITEALEAMLQKAKEEKCFEKRRSAFNPCDFLTEFLYQHNLVDPKREFQVQSLGDIPFVQEYWKTQPRPPLPLSLVWNEEEAALKIQCFFRGYLVRREPEVQELRKWQADWRHINADGHVAARKFWADKVPPGPVDGEEEDELFS